MFHPIQQLVSRLPAGPRATLQRFVPSTAPEPPPERPQSWRPSALWSRWFDVLGPDLDLKDLEIDPSELERDLRHDR
ncbi:MAG: hypothetical protein EP329_18335 [Deltaproteobacteria bacterium]|nr:MAG: hypothetical protein EP329_18335 [Deltaproteobacteria bacterium]